MRQARRHRPRPGSAAVEVAVLLPFLAALIVGIAELGQAMSVHQSLNDAVRKGGRHGILPNRTTAQIQSDVAKVLTENNISSSSATVTVLVNGQNVDASTAQRGDQISVTVSVPFSQVSWGFTRFLGSNANIVSTLVMLRQG